MLTLSGLSARPIQWGIKSDTNWDAAVREEDQQGGLHQLKE